ncbi:MAG: hypothetical protein C0592_02705 [Marinilabiliales bacterium]|nr:MAG: hypothetical protein C0592_02705 [Marinilabiliales bacterium]
MFKYKLKHFYFNKYFLSIFKRKKYFLSYDYKHKALWYRTYKVASRTIDKKLREDAKKGQYIYGSLMAYSPRMFRKYFKFAFVRHPEARFISVWKDKILRQNYFVFPESKWEDMKELDNFLSWVETLNINKCDEHLRAQNALIDLNHVDFVGRLENLNRDFEYLASKIGVSSTELEHLNKTPEKELELTTEQKQRIFNIYRKDFEVFYPGYQDNLHQ